MSKTESLNNEIKKIIKKIKQECPNTLNRNKLAFASKPIIDEHFNNVINDKNTYIDNFAHFVANMIKSNEYIKAIKDVLEGCYGYRLKELKENKISQEM